MWKTKSKHLKPDLNYKKCRMPKSFAQHCKWDSPDHTHPHKFSHTINLLLAGGKLVQARENAEDTAYSLIWQVPSSTFQKSVLTMTLKVHVQQVNTYETGKARALTRLYPPADGKPSLGNVLRLY